MTTTPAALPVLGEWHPVAAPAPAPDEQAAAARAEADALLAQANRTRARAEQDAARIREAAQADARRHVERAAAEAERIREQTRAAAAKTAKRGGLINEWSPRVALGATIGLTASGEFALAQLAGWAPGLAWLLPLAIDVYVVQAFRRHRDVAPALILMVAANAIYHLAAEGLFGVVRSHGESNPTWWLIVGVAAIAPLVMWRIHRITAPPRERKRRESPAGESAAPAAAAPAGGDSESARPPAGESADTPRESGPGVAGESARENDPQRGPATAPSRESRPKAKRAPRESKPRESAPAVSPIGDIEDEIRQLLALMVEREGAEAVTLTDAERITGRSQATAARRLAAARDRYRKTA